MKKVFASLALVVLLVNAGCNKDTSTSKGPDGKELTLEPINSVAVAQDDTAKVDISVERKKFEDPVTIKFEPPEGVTVTESDTKLDEGVNKRTFTLKATDKAKVGKHKMMVVASSDGMNSTREVTIEVKEKSTRSVSGSSPVSGSDADIKEKRQKLEAAIKAKMKEIDDSMDTLRERVKTADAKTKEKLDERIKQLHIEHQDLRKQYDQIATATAANWNDFSTRLTNAAHKLAEGARKALDEFKK